MNEKNVTIPQFDVPQLRRAADAVQEFFDMSPDMVKTRTAVANLMRGAADEIERLRRANKDLSDVVSTHLKMGCGDA